MNHRHISKQWGQVLLSMQRFFGICLVSIAILTLLIATTGLCAADRDATPSLFFLAAGIYLMGTKKIYLV